MWPWGHLAVGYLLYSSLSRWRRGRPPDGVEALALAFGTQFPDLVDKPLAWTFGLLPNGRSLAHSLLVATVVVALVAAVCRRAGRPVLAEAFGVGYLSHLAGDLIPAVLYGVPGEWKFLFWPVFPPVDYDPSFGFYEHFVALELTPFLGLQLAFSVFTVAVWLVDGAPGVRELVERIRR